MIGIVVVSHSHDLGQAVVGLASEMVPESGRPAIAVAAGLDQTTFGTDAAAIAAAIEQVDSPEGVLVLLDLGSAILSAEMALEFVDPELAERVRLSPAPLVEGLVAAVVTASTGASLDEVDAQARAGLQAKQEHLGEAAPEPASPLPSDPEALNPDATFRGTLTNPHGLHARPAATLVSALAGFDAEVLLSNPARNKGPVSASSVVQLARLDLRQGDDLVALATGPDADAALSKLAELVAAGFGENTADAEQSSAEPALGKPHLTSPVTAPAILLPEIATAEASTDDTGGMDAFEHARAVVDDFLTQQANQRSAPAAIAEIFAAQRALLRDPGLTKAVRVRLPGQGLERAVLDACTEQASMLEALSDEYLRERAQDLRSLARLLLRALRGEPLLDPLPASPHILVGHELDAVTAAQLNPTHTLGVATVAPGTTGHGALIAALLGVPIMTGQAEADQINSGTLVTLDPERGLTSPSEG